MARERRRVRARPVPRSTRLSGEVTPDTLTTVSVTESLAGNSAVESAIVRNLSGPSGIIRLDNAISSVGIPQLGDIHSRLGVPVQSVTAQFLEDSNTQALVTITYGLAQGGGGFLNDPDDENAQPQIEILSTLQPVQTQFDVSGIVLNTGVYDEFPRGPDGNIIAGPPERFPPQGGEIEDIVPMHTVIARRLERESPGIWKSPAHSGTINSTLVFGDPIHFWLANIEGSSDDGGDTWNVTYTFQRNPDTWNSVIVYQDPETGRVGRDVEAPENMTPGSTGNGSKVIQSRPATDFRLLELPMFD